MVVMKMPFVIVFSNFLANFSSLSVDRWQVKRIGSVTKELYDVTGESLQDLKKEYSVYLKYL
jgi:hypothetical protein